MESTVVVLLGLVPFFLLFRGVFQMNTHPVFLVVGLLGLIAHGWFFTPVWQEILYRLLPSSLPLSLSIGLILGVIHAIYQRKNSCSQSWVDNRFFASTYLLAVAETFLIQGLLLMIVSDFPIYALVIFSGVCSVLVRFGLSRKMLVFSALYSSSCMIICVLLLNVFSILIAVLVSFLLLLSSRNRMSRLAT